MNLYELGNQYRMLMAAAEEFEEGVFEDTLESLEDAIEEKAINIAKLLKIWESDIEGLKKEKTRLDNRQRNLEEKSRRLKQHLQDNLEQLDIFKIKTPLFSFNIQNNPPKARITNITTIPAEYFKQPEPILSKTELTKALKAGVKVQGAELIQEKSLRIK